MQSLVFCMTALRGTNKVGLIKPDEHGYYNVVLGALNGFNRSGDFYPFTELVAEIFKGSSSFMRKIQGQALRGEYEHPLPEKDMSPEAYLARIAHVDPHNISHHIAEVTLDFENFKDEQGRKIVAVLGLVKPAGPKGHLLQQAFDNPRENVAFSIRSLSVNSRRMDGTLQRDIREIITWDYVTEGGIKIADKFYSPSLESLERFDNASFPITETMVRNVQKNAQKEGIALENNFLDFTDLMVSMGWEKRPNKILDW